MTYEYQTRVKLFPINFWRFMAWVYPINHIRTPDWYPHNNDGLVSA